MERQARTQLKQKCGPRFSRILFLFLSFSFFVLVKFKWNCTVCRKAHSSVFQAAATATTTMTMSTNWWTGALRVFFVTFSKIMKFKTLTLIKCDYLQNVTYRFAFRSIQSDWPFGEIMKFKMLTLMKCDYTQEKKNFTYPYRNREREKNTEN